MENCLEQLTLPFIWTTSLLHSTWQTPHLILLFSISLKSYPPKLKHPSPFFFWSAMDGSFPVDDTEFVPNSSSFPTCFLLPEISLELPLPSAFLLSTFFFLLLLSLNSEYLRLNSVMFEKYSVQYLFPFMWSINLVHSTSQMPHLTLELSVSLKRISSKMKSSFSSAFSGFFWEPSETLFWAISSFLIFFGGGLWSCSLSWEDLEIR